MVYSKYQILSLYCISNYSIIIISFLMSALLVPVTQQRRH
jgi:hypothetical protein